MKGYHRGQAKHEGILKNQFLNHEKDLLQFLPCCSASCPFVIKSQYMKIYLFAFLQNSYSARTFLSVSLEKTPNRLHWVGGYPSQRMCSRNPLSTSNSPTLFGFGALGGWIQEGMGYSTRVFRGYQYPRFYFASLQLIRAGVKSTNSAFSKTKR